MKQKYLVYSLFGLLAMNMSWNFTASSTKRGEVSLASQLYQVASDKRVRLSEVSSTDAEVVLDASGKELPKTSQKTFRIEKTEGTICDCLIGTEIVVDVKQDGSISNLVAAIEAAEKTARDEKEQKDKELADRRKAQEEQKKKEEACILEERDERLLCHTEKIEEIAQELKEKSCRTTTDKECVELENKYYTHKDAIVATVDELIEASSDEDGKVARQAQRQLNALKRSSSPIVKRTVSALLNTESEFSQVESTFSKIPQLMRMAITTANPAYGFAAQQLEQQLKFFIQNSDILPGLTRLMDKSYNGGLSEDHIQYFADRNSTLRKALNLEAIYPSQINLQSLGGNSTSMITPAVDFRGNGFSGGASSLNIRTSGTLDAANLPSNISGTQTTSTLVNPIGSRLITR